jgi:hypothetical protein
MGHLLSAKPGVVRQVKLLDLRHLLEHFIQLSYALIVKVDLTDGQVLKIGQRLHGFQELEDGWEWEFVLGDVE